MTDRELINLLLRLQRRMAMGQWCRGGSVELMGDDLVLFTLQEGDLEIRRVTTLADLRAMRFPELMVEDTLSWLGRL